MFGNLLGQFNWIDILVVITLFRSAYIGIKQGFIIEIFKISGIIFTCYFTLHYYSGLGLFLANRTPVSLFACDVLSYLLISIGVLLIFTLLRQSLLTLIKIETIDFLKYWGGGILGLARGLLLASLICLFMFIFNNDYLRGSVRQAFSGTKITSIAPAAYKFIFNNLIVKFAPDSKFNQHLFDTLEE